jgi:hypothetical protein
MEQWVVRVIGLPEVTKNGPAVLLVSHFGKPDRGFEGLELAEVESAIAILVEPVLEELPSSGGHARVVRHTPARDGTPNVIDEFVFLDPVSGPLGFEFELLSLLLGLRDRDEVAGDAARVYDAVRDAVLVELEMTRRLVVGRV